MKTYIIYAFADPRNRAVRYIGISTRSAARRYLEMRSHGRKRLPMLADWFEELNDCGLHPELITLETSPPDGMDGERRWIALFRAAGAALFNKADGGQGSSGVLHTPERKALISKALQGHIASSETRRKISEAKRGRSRPDLAMRNRQNAKLTPEQVCTIRRRLGDGEKGITLARDFGVAPSIITVIRQNRR